MLPPYLICEFDKKNLSSLVRERFGDDFPNINKKRQIQYIYNYLRDLKAKTVLLESEYVDRDYLEDYSKYYVRCFNRYGERCARIHFFRHEFDSKEFSELLTSNDNKKINKYKNQYLGFIVIKPLPKTFIGKSCLKIYNSFKKANYKGLIRKSYNVNLFGLPLEVNSVAFQEQDKVVSACATTAIWSMFHAQADFDHRKIPSCSSITLSAINHIVDSSNSFPNKGLTNKQILRAIDTQNYRNHKIELHKGISSEQFVDLIEILINSGIPAIMGADVYQLEDGQWHNCGSHAVTVLGYRKGDKPAVYIHDDRIGPYAMAAIREKEAIVGLEIEESNSWLITLQDKDDNGKWVQSRELLLPESLIIPTNHKVRIPFDYIENTCRAIKDEWLRYCNTIVEETKDTDAPFLKYSISLTNLSDLKSEILLDKNVFNKHSVLTQGYARFLWKASFTLENQAKIFEIIFDATDIPQGNAVSSIIIYQQDIFSAIKNYFLSIATDALQDIDHQNFLASFIRKMKTRDEGYFTYLSNKYGHLNAPKRIRSTEIFEGNLPERTDIKVYYGREGKKLADDFPTLMHNPEKSYRIWVISHDGALILGEERDGMGHPSLTGFKSARIAGELRFRNERWEINDDSGRFSTNYTNSKELLINALDRFREVYDLETNIHAVSLNDHKP